MTTTELLTRSEALKKAKAAPSGTRFLLRIRNDAPIAGNAEQCFSGALSSYAPVSRKEATRLIDSMLSPTLEARGARMPVEFDDTKFWFGA